MTRFSLGNPLHPTGSGAYCGLMSDDFDGGDFDTDSDNHEHEIPDDLTDDVQERIDQAVEDCMGDLYEDSRPRTGGCLLILALPALALWFLG